MGLREGKPVRLLRPNVTLIRSGTAMQIQSRFTFDKVKFDQENNIHLAISLKAPATNWQEKRPPVCIIPVIDRSSSMSGEKLDYAKKSVIKLIEHLKPGDFCGVVTFDDNVITVAKPMEMTQSKKEQLRAEVGKLNSQGCTNFSGGMCEALEHANKGDLPEGMLIRVIMFTDGQANRGIATTREQLLPLLEKSLGKVTLSAFGYGQDAVQELLADLAKKGKGNYAFVKNPDDALSAFAKELGGLLSTYAQNITISVSPHNGHRISEVISDVDVEQKGNDVTIKLSDILAEEERHIILAVKLSKQNQALPRAMNIADVKVTYELLDETGKRETKTEELKAKISFVKDGEEQTEPTPDVMKVVGLAQIVKIQAEAEVFAKRGDFQGAFDALQQGEDYFIPLRMDPQAEVLRNAKAKMANQQVYTANAGYFASVQSGGTRGCGTSGMDAEAQVVLSSVGGGASNSAQQAVVQSFTGGGGVHVHPAVGAAPVQPVFPVPMPAPVAPAKKEDKKPKGLSKKRSSARW